MVFLFRNRIRDADLNITVFGNRARDAAPGVTVYMPTRT